MRLFSLFSLLILLLVNPIVAQEESTKDPRAKTILDKLSAANRKNESLYVKFAFHMVNKQDGIDEKQKGELWIKGDKYKLTLPGIERYSDGTTLWTYLTEDDECQITSAGNEEDESSFSPSQMLTIYEQGYNYTYEGKQKVNGLEVDQIKLFPEKGGKPYHSIILQVNSSSNQLYQLIVKGKDGNTYTYTLSEQSPNPKVSDTFFTLNTDNIGDVIDLRE